jgi:diaminohydroxyphosphoribosylaminopyrimidine deaminase / 5-amino-6-(5-phosphoribosylamino)uracil reductase
LKGGDPARRAAFRSAGVELIEVPPTQDRTVDMAKAVQELGQRGLTRVLVEGGATLAAVLIGARLVDRLAWFHAPLLIGGDGIPAVAPLGIETLGEAPRFERIALEQVGDDVLETLKRS